MQKIRLKDFTTDGKMYSVYLGNGTTHRFASKRSCSAFLANTSKYMTSKFHELWDIYRDVLEKYNDFWLYMDGEPTKARKLRGELEDAEKGFEKAVASVNRKQDGNIWPFIHLLKVACYLKNTIKELERENLKKSITHQRYQFDNLFSRLQTIEAELNTYGQRTADVITVPQHNVLMQVAG